jgi:methylenetetrahydrofolate dehydrogenase (NADP+)/methenyltetrahydrofolate cyclohydrolase
MVMGAKNIKIDIYNKLKDKVIGLDRVPSFTVIQVGNNEASNIYIANKKKMAYYIGYKFSHVKLETTTTEELIDIVNKLNDDKNVDGILIQMPLPDNIDTIKVLNTINPNKDIDGLTDYNSGRLLHEEKCLLPCTPAGIVKLLDYYDINVEGCHTVILGRSNLVGKPLANMLINKRATVTACNSKTENLKKYTLDADILIVATGHKHLVTKDMVKEGSIVIDVGISRIDNKIYGDVDFDNVIDKVKYITPVPGGVGQMTMAMLANNIYKAYELNH